MFHSVDATDDPVVTTYMDCILQACKRIDENSSHCAFKDKKEKHAVMVNDSVITAFYYMVHGYKNNAVWIQGIIPEESYMRNHSKLRVMCLNALERIVLRRCQFVFFVSEEMRRHYECKYRMDFSGRHYVMPCFNETGIYQDAFLMPAKFEKNRFLYVGGLQEWQCFEKTVQLFALIEKKSQLPVEFCVLTREVDQASEILNSVGVKSFTVDSVPADQVKDRIKDCKYGFVLRENMKVNTVATPTKFSNYLSCGVIPVYCGCLKSFTEMDRQYGVGLCVDINHLEQAADDIITDMMKPRDGLWMKKQCETIFATYYGSDYHIDRIAKALKEVVWKKK